MHTDNQTKAFLFLVIWQTALPEFFAHDNSRKESENYREKIGVSFEPKKKLTKIVTQHVLPLSSSINQLFFYFVRDFLKLMQRKTMTIPNTNPFLSILKEKKN